MSTDNTDVAVANDVGHKISDLCHKGANDKGANELKGLKRTAEEKGDDTKKQKKDNNGDIEEAEHAHKNNHFPKDASADGKPQNNFSKTLPAEDAADEEEGDEDDEEEVEEVEGEEEDDEEDIPEGDEELDEEDEEEEAEAEGDGDEDEDDA